MNLQLLLTNLASNDPATRLSAVRILGLVEEINALPAIRQRFAAETDPEVKKALDWAGRRLFAAHQAGYSTLNEIFRHFKIDAEIENAEDPTETQLMQRLQDGFESDLRKMQMGGSLRNTITGAAVGALVGGAAGAASGAMMGAMAASSNMGEKRPEVGKQRIPPQVPAKTNFDIWLRRLRDTSTPANREKAVLEIVHLNNPAALPALAEAYIGATESLQNAILKAAKTLYWSAMYWELSQDGTVDQEMKRRLEAKGKATPATMPSQQSEANKRATQETSKEELAQILARAQEAKEKRKKK